MNEFVIGVITIVISYIFVMSYVPTNSTKKYAVTKRKANAVTGTAGFEIITFIVILIAIASGGLGVLMTALGLGVGLSLMNKGNVVIFGKDKWWKK